MSVTKVRMGLGTRRWVQTSGGVKLDWGISDANRVGCSGCKVCRVGVQAGIRGKQERWTHGVRVLRAG